MEDFDDFDDEAASAALNSKMGLPAKAKKTNVPGLLVEIDVLKKWEHRISRAAVLEFTEEKWKQFEKMAAMHCTKDEIADVFGVTPQMLGNKVKERYGEGFGEVIKRFSGVGKASLRRLQWQKAEEGDTKMQIFLGKQILGQAEKSESKTDTNINIAVTKEQRDAVVNRLLENYGDDLVIDVEEYEEIPAK